MSEFRDPASARPGMSSTKVQTGIGFSRKRETQIVPKHTGILYLDKWDQLTSPLDQQALLEQPDQQIDPVDKVLEMLGLPAITSYYVTG
jgi:hypothetical protein